MAKHRDTLAQAKAQIVIISKVMSVADKAKSIALSNPNSAIDVKRFDELSEKAYECMSEFMHFLEELASGKSTMSENDAKKMLESMQSDVQSKITDFWFDLNSESEAIADALLDQSRMIRRSNRVVADELASVFEKQTVIDVEAAEQTLA